MKEKVRYYLEELQMSPEQIVGYCKKHGNQYPAANGRCRIAPSHMIPGSVDRMKT